MVFTDARFFAILILCWLSFFAVSGRFRALVLAGWGLVFYAMYAVTWLPLMAGMAAVTYVLAGRWGVWILAALLVPLFVGFKFKIGAIAQAAIPLGFSFLAFELLHYAIERRRGRLSGAGPVGLAAFAFFFPCRVAGPIKRYNQFMEAVASAKPSFEHVYTGVTRIAIGLVKKFALADVVSLTAAEIIYVDNTAQAWRVVIAYGLQLYLDFSAYSDIAIGASRILGIVIPENFRWPYLSPNIQEFWTRWHISLSSWARDYVFMPVGQVLFKTRVRRAPAFIAAVSYLATFLTIGAWHGLTWNYLIWGAYHAVLVIVYYVYRTRIPAALAASRWFQSWPAAVAGGCLTFLLVTVGWLPFMTDLPRALVLLKLLFHAA